MATQPISVMPHAAGPLSAADVLRAVFPPSAGPALSDVAVHVISNGGQPRWIVLGNPRRALPVLSSWAPWNLSSQLRWHVVRLAASAGMLPNLPGVQSSHAQLDWSYWMRNLSLPHPPSSAVLHVGSPSHTRKAILFALDEGEIRWAAKVPLVSLASGAILNEAAILSHVQRFHIAPRTLFEDPAAGIAAQSWLKGRAVGRRLTESHIDLLSVLAEPGEYVRVGDTQASLAAELDALDLPVDRTSIARALDLLAYDVPLPAFVEHRDFAPWNLKWLSKQSLGLLDWEWAVRRSLPWQDICRFFYNEDAHFHGPGHVWETMMSYPVLKLFLHRFEVPVAAVPALTAHYLLRVLCMDWAAGNHRLAMHTYGQVGRLLQVPQLANPKF